MWADATLVLLVAGLLGLTIALYRPVDEHDRRQRIAAVAAAYAEAEADYATEVAARDETVEDGHSAP